jgi:Sigma-70 region 2
VTHPCLDRGVTDVAVSHDELRPLMFSIAYRMLGSATEAEDIVQEAFLRMHRDTTRARSAEALLAAVQGGHEASLWLGMVLGLRKPRPGSGGACSCSCCRVGAQSVAAASAMAVRAEDSSTMCFLVV